MSLEFAFDRPKHGWLPVEITIDGQTLSFAASNVLNDPVAELAAAGLSVLRRADSAAAINWWLEPNWHTLFLEPSLDNGMIYVSLHCDHDGNEKSARCIYETVAPTLTICREIASSLRSLAHRIGHTEYEDSKAWNHVFPEETIAEIYSHIKDKSRKGKLGRNGG